MAAAIGSPSLPASLSGLISRAQLFREVRNYNALMAILSGLNHGSVSRLVATWAVSHQRGLIVIAVIDRGWILLNLGRAEAIYGITREHHGVDGQPRELQVLSEGNIECPTAHHPLFCIHSEGFDLH